MNYTTKIMQHGPPYLWKDQVVFAGGAWEAARMRAKQTGVVKGDYIHVQGDGEYRVYLVMGGRRLRQVV